ncbi:segregation and condensation protein A [Streptomyces albus]|uniref:segregation and condensation protein A n=1 Tax=Streptomyces albus TaxID=1888 RepID=UPI0006E1562B|nr:segregation/condensation protein A [Streptomyces albus]
MPTPPSDDTLRNRGRRPLGRGPGAVSEPAPAPAPRPAAPDQTAPRQPASGTGTGTVEPDTHPEAEGTAEPEPGSETDATETGAGPRTEAEPRAEAAPEPRTEAGPEPETGADPDTEGEPETEAGSGNGAEPRAEAAPERAEAEPRTDPEPRAEAEPEAGPGIEAEPHTAQEPGPHTEGDPEPEPDDGRFRVVLDNFEGPFDLLLQLISKHKLDVTEVALSKVTDEFMAHIRAMGPDWDLDQTTEFLVVAATLLDLKAARLLPQAEVEDEADLALLEARDLLFARLLQYRAYKQIAQIFADRLDVEARRFPRTVGLEPHHAELLPEVALSVGPEGFARLAVKAMRPKPKPQVYVEHIHAPLVSVREQAQVVVARLRERGEATFQELTEDADDTLTVVARFLALLELYRERAVALEQEEALGVLLVRWSGTDDAQPRVTDEFDQEPGERKDE